MTLQWKLESLQSQSNYEEHLEELHQRKQIGASDDKAMSKCTYWL